jgi:hypothetical protein
MRADEVAGQKFESNPLSIQPLGGFGGRATAGKRVQNQVTLGGEKLEVLFWRKASAAWRRAE